MELGYDQIMEMSRLLGQAAALQHGSLQEILFLDGSRDCIFVFEDGAGIPSQHTKHSYNIEQENFFLETSHQFGGVDPFSVFGFGYPGIGQRALGCFIYSAGFKGTIDLIKTEAPLKVTADGRQVASEERRLARYAAEVSGTTLEEAKSKLAVPESETCLLSEEVLYDGSDIDLTVMVETSSTEEARKYALRKLPPNAEVLEVSIVDREILNTYILIASDKSAAESAARSRLGESLLTVSCTTEPRRGFLGIGKRAGEYEAKYCVPQKEATIRFRPPVVLRVEYGTAKLKCNKCGELMEPSTEGVVCMGGQAPIIRLRCRGCDISRFENRSEVEGQWIKWKDGTATLCSYGRVVVQQGMVAG